MLYTTEIELTTQKQLVLDLRAELQKVKDVAKKVTQVAKETTKAVRDPPMNVGWRIQRSGWLRRWPECIGITALRPG